MDELESKISKRKDVSPKEGEHEYGDVNFADETNKKYPLDSPSHVRSAWSYINMPKNAAKYSSEEVAAIKKKIAAAWRDKIDKAGPPSAEAKESMEDEKKEPVEEEKKETPQEEKKEEEKKVEASVLEAEIEKLKAALAEANAKLEATEKALSDEKTARALVEARYTERVLANVFEGEELKATVEKAKGMTLDQIDLVASAAGKRSAPKESGLKFLDLSGGAKDAPAKDKLTL